MPVGYRCQVWDQWSIGGTKLVGQSVIDGELWLITGDDHEFMNWTSTSHDWAFVKRSFKNSQGGIFWVSFHPSLQLETSSHWVVWNVCCAVSHASDTQQSFAIGDSLMLHPTKHSNPTKRYQRCFAHCSPLVTCCLTNHINKYTGWAEWGCVNVQVWPTTNHHPLGLLPMASYGLCLTMADNNG